MGEQYAGNFFADDQPTIFPCSTGRLSLGEGFIWAMLFMKLIWTD